MLRVAATVALVVGISRLASVAHADPQLPVAPEVWLVLTGGTWSDGPSRYGRYRLVVLAVGVEEVRHDLFVQLIEVQPGGAEASQSVVRTIEVTEVSTSRELITIDKAEARGVQTADREGVVFKGILRRRTRDGEVGVERFRLEVIGKGPYKWTSLAVRADEREM